MTRYSRYIGIDYSGAETPEASLKGLRVYMAVGQEEACEIAPPPSTRKYWTRRGVAEWLVERLGEDIPTAVGIDHGFSFPIRYFEFHSLPANWDQFLIDFQRHWPADKPFTYVEFIRDGGVGAGDKRMGSPRWRRLCEERCGAKSVFHFDVQGSVAKSTHSGLPWLLYTRQKLGARVHFWPFDGWQTQLGQSLIAEVYPRLIKHTYSPGKMTPDQYDAYAIASWLRDLDQGNQIMKKFSPTLSPAEKAIAQVEGWILGLS